MELNFVLDDGSIFEVISNYKSGQIDRIELNNVISDFNFLSDSIRSHSVGAIYSNVGILLDCVDGENIADFIYDQNNVDRDKALSLSINIDRSEKYIPEDHFSEDIYDQGGWCSCCFALSTGATIVAKRTLSTLAFWNDSFFMVDNESNLIARYRSHIVHTSPSEEVIWSYSDIMWSNLYFVKENVEFKNFDLHYRNAVEIVVRHLSYLNDFSQDHKQNDPDNFIGEAGSQGVDLSPESPNTHKNKDAMKERWVSIGGESVLCEWHTKLQPQIDRIHFNIGSSLSHSVSNITKGKVVIGIFTDHLTV